MCPCPVLVLSELEVLSALISISVCCPPSPICLLDAPPAAYPGALSAFLLSKNLDVAKWWLMALAVRGWWKAG